MKGTKKIEMTYNFFGKNSCSLTDILKDLSNKDVVGFSLTLLFYGTGCLLIMFALNRILRKVMGRYTTQIEETKIKQNICIKLLQAIGSGETNKCLDYIRSYPEVINFQLPNGNTPFLKACACGCKKIVIEMLTKGADINSCTVKGDHPFFLAVYGIITRKIHDFSILNVLIEAGCSVNQTKNNGYSALHLAARSGHPQLVRWLLMHGADPNPRTLSATPYMLAYRNGHSEAAALLYINLGRD